MSNSESGWDFSSRWLYLDDLATIHVTDIIPVDLNAIMYANELTLSVLHCAEGKARKERGEGDEREMAKSAEYLSAAKVREGAMDRYLWQENLSSWADYNIASHTHRHGKPIPLALSIFFHNLNDTFFVDIDVATLCLTIQGLTSRTTSLCGHQPFKVPCTKLLFSLSLLNAKTSSARSSPLPLLPPPPPPLSTHNISNSRVSLSSHPDSCPTLGAFPRP